MRTYIILGMGRSSTSFLAECLKKNGVNIGDVFYMGENPNGGYENQEFVDLNKQVLTDAKMGWGLGAIPAKPLDLKNSFFSHKPKYRKLIKKFGKGDWGVKEPRLSLLADDFLQVVKEFDDDPFIYVAFRDPKKVAESLRECNPDITLERGEEVAREYNRRLIDFIYFNYVKKQ